MKKTMLLLVAAVALTAGSPSAAQAGHDSPLYEAADRYRDAVQHFEEDVHDADYFNRYDEKLVDRLEDATSHLRSAADDLDHPDRLLYQWDEVRSLQPRVERAIFGRRCYPPDPQLMRCWDAVWIAYEGLAREMHVVASRPFCAAPEICSGQCGYHGEHRSRHGHHEHAPRPASDGGYGQSGKQRRTGPGAWDWVDSRRETIPGNPPHRDSKGGDLSTAVVGPLIRGLLD